VPPDIPETEDPVLTNTPPLPIAVDEPVEKVVKPDALRAEPVAMVIDPLLDASLPPEAMVVDPPMLEELPPAVSEILPACSLPGLLTTLMLPAFA
jgi:hypothetical protein